MYAQDKSVFADLIKLRIEGTDGSEAQAFKDILTHQLRNSSCPTNEIFADRIMDTVKVKVMTSRKNGSSRKSYHFIFTGIIADQVLMALSPRMAMYLEEIHVKSYHYLNSAEKLLELKNALTDGPMPLNVDVFGPRREGLSSKSGPYPGIRFGSNKSDLQVVLYQRAGQPMGVETKVQDAKFKRLLRKYQELNPNDGTSRDKWWYAFLMLLQGEGFAVMNNMRAVATPGADFQLVGLPLSSWEMASVQKPHTDQAMFTVGGRLMNEKGFFTENSVGYEANQWALANMMRESYALHYISGRKGWKHEELIDAERGIAHSRRSTDRNDERSDSDASTESNW